jgi:DNA-binding FadR family transcriptional regulator
MLGVSRVAAGKALKRMQADGLVVPRYGRIEVPHIRRLREMVAAEDQFFPLD